MKSGVPLKKVRLIFFVGLNSGFVTNGEPDQRFINFYTRRSSSAVHCVILGNVVVPYGYATNLGTPTISRASVWASIAKAISDRGSVPGIQLATVWKDYKGPRNFRPRVGIEAIRKARELVGSLGTNQLASVLRSFQDGTSMALDAGFKHVQFHAAHGYLLNLLIDDRIFDGANDVRAQLADLIHMIRSVGVDTSVRMSLRSGDAEFDAVGTEAFHDRIVASPADYIDVSSGYYSIDKRLIYPARPDIVLSRRRETLALANRHPQKQFILSGRAMRESEATLPANVHLGLCRDLIANPDFLTDPTRGCENSGKCHYFSKGATYVTCPQWNKERL